MAALLALLRPLGSPARLMKATRARAGRVRPLPRPPGRSLSSAIGRRRRLYRPALGRGQRGSGGRDPTRTPLSLVSRHPAVTRPATYASSAYLIKSLTVG